MIAGTVVRKPELRRSPAGIPILRLVLQHESLQQEGGHPRKVQCRIGVVAVGTVGERWAKVAPGERLRVDGFLSRAGYRDGDSRLVVHAKVIELIDVQGERGHGAATREQEH